MADGGRLLAFCHLSFLYVLERGPYGVGVGRSPFPRLKPCYATQPLCGYDGVTAVWMDAGLRLRLCDYVVSLL